MQVKELGHLVLYVQDLRRSADFYGQVLGCGGGLPRDAGHARGRFLVGSHPSRAAPDRGRGGRRRPTRGPPRRPLPLRPQGRAIPTTSLRDAALRLEEAGVTVVGASDHTVTHSLYILDPDGNEVELYIDVPGVDWKSDPSLIMAPIRPLAL